MKFFEPVGVAGQRCGPFVAPLPGNAVHLLVQSLDGPESRIVSVPCFSFMVEPLAETALAHIQRRRSVALTVEIVFHGGDPCSMLHSGEKEGEVVTVNGPDILPS